MGTRHGCAWRICPMRVEVAIPSYQRAETLHRKTLHTLLAGGMDPGTITVFVADATEYATYSRTLVPGTYGQLVIGRPTLQGARAFIQTYYAEGTPVLNVDDDVSGVLQAVTPQQLQPVQDLVALVEEAFHLARQHGVGLWGVYPVANAYFMQETI